MSRPLPQLPEAGASSLESSDGSKHHVSDGAFENELRRAIAALRSASASSRAPGAAPPRPTQAAADVRSGGLEAAFKGAVQHVDGRSTGSLASASASGDAEAAAASVPGSAASPATSERAPVLLPGADAAKSRSPADEAESKRRRMRGFALQEVLSSELAFLLHLHRLANLFARPLRGAPPVARTILIAPAYGSEGEGWAVPALELTLPTPSPFLLASAATVASSTAASANGGIGSGTTASGSASGKGKGKPARSPRADAEERPLLDLKQVGGLLTSFEHERLFGSAEHVAPLHETLAQELATALRVSGLAVPAAGAQASAASGTVALVPVPELLAPSDGGLGAGACRPVPADPDAICIGALFVRLSPFLRMWSRYSAGHAGADAELRARLAHVVGSTAGASTAASMAAAASGAGAGGSSWSTGGSYGYDESSAAAAAAEDEAFAEQVWSLVAEAEGQRAKEQRKLPTPPTTAGGDGGAGAAGGDQSRYSWGAGAAARGTRGNGKGSAGTVVPVTFPRFVRLMERDPACAGQFLASLLAMPIQRVLRYSLLLKEVLAHTPAGHPDAPDLQRALELLGAAATKLDASVARYGAQLQLMALESRLNPRPNPTIVAPHRRLVREGMLRKVCRPFRLKSYTFVLLSDLLLYGDAKASKASKASKGSGLRSKAFGRGKQAADATAVSQPAAAKGAGAGASPALDADAPVGSAGIEPIRVHQIVVIVGVRDLPTGKSRRQPDSDHDDDGGRKSTSTVPRQLEHGFLVLGQPKSFIAVAESAEDKIEWMAAIAGCVDTENVRRGSKGLPLLTHDLAAPILSVTPGNEAASCELCGRPFRVLALRVRHVCERCGRHVCGYCSATVSAEQAALALAVPRGTAWRGRLRDSIEQQRAQLGTQVVAAPTTAEATSALTGGASTSAAGKALRRGREARSSSSGSGSAGVEEAEADVHPFSAADAEAGDAAGVDTASSSLQSDRREHGRSAPARLAAIPEAGAAIGSTAAVRVRDSGIGAGSRSAVHVHAVPSVSDLLFPTELHGYRSTATASALDGVGAAAGAGTGAEVQGHAGGSGSGSRLSFPRPKSSSSGRAASDLSESDAAEAAAAEAEGMLTASGRPLLAAGTGSSMRLCSACAIEVDSAKQDIRTAAVEAAVAATVEARTQPQPAAVPHDVAGRQPSASKAPRAAAATSPAAAAAARLPSGSAASVGSGAAAAAAAVPRHRRVPSGRSVASATAATATATGTGKSGGSTGPLITLLQEARGEASPQAAAAAGASSTSPFSPFSPSASQRADAARRRVAAFELSLSRGIAEGSPGSSTLKSPGSASASASASSSAGLAPATAGARGGSGAASSGGGGYSLEDEAALQALLEDLSLAARQREQRAAAATASAAAAAGQRHVAASSAQHAAQGANTGEDAWAALLHTQPPSHAELAPSGLPRAQAAAIAPVQPPLSWQLLHIANDMPQAPPDVLRERVQRAAAASSVAARRHAADAAATAHAARKAVSSASSASSPAAAAPASSALDDFFAPAPAAPARSSSRGATTAAPAPAPAPVPAPRTLPVAASGPGVQPAAAASEATASAAMAGGWPSGWHSAGSGSGYGDAFMQPTAPTRVMIPTGAQPTALAHIAWGLPHAHPQPMMSMGMGMGMGMGTGTGMMGYPSSGGGGGMSYPGSASAGYPIGGMGYPSGGGVLPMPQAQPGPFPVPPQAPTQHWPYGQPQHAGYSRGPTGYGAPPAILAGAGAGGSVSRLGAEFRPSATATAATVFPAPVGSAAAPAAALAGDLYASASMRRDSGPQAPPRTASSSGPAAATSSASRPSTQAAFESLVLEAARGPPKR